MKAFYLVATIVGYAATNTRRARVINQYAASGNGRPRAVNSTVALPPAIVSEALVVVSPQSFSTVCTGARCDR